MRKTNAELADFFGIKVGDIIEFEAYGHTHKVKLVSLDDKVDGLVCIEKENEGLGFHLSYLIDADYKIIKTPKHVGEKMCVNFLKCEDCPLGMLLKCGGNCLGLDASLYRCLDKAFENEKTPSSHPVYKAYKQLLDAEI